MKDLFNSPPVFLEIAPASLKALRENAGIELPLERSVDGKITAASREKTIAALQQFVGRKSWQPRLRAVCGISLHGVSLRKISLPPATGDELDRVLRLQIENEFPLSPADLGWGWKEISRDSAKLEAVVVAVRKEAIQEYESLLVAAGLNPEFTVAEFARNELCPTPKGSQAVLEVSRTFAELAVFEKEVPVAVKILPVNGDLVDAVVKNAGAKTVYVSGTTPDGFFDRLFARTDCRRLEIPAGDGVSAATLGLKKSSAADLLILNVEAKPTFATGKFNLSQLDFSHADTRLWLMRGAVLLAVLLVFPFAEALFFKPLLALKLDRLKSERQHFVSVVQPEMDFLQSLKQSQPPYLDTLYIFSKAAPPGLHLDSITINQQGNIAVKASMQNAQQVMDFRSNLIGTGFFANITVEEQSPVPGQPKVGVRMTAQWKPVGTRTAVRIALPASDAAKTNGGNTAALSPGSPDLNPNPNRPQT